MTTTATPATTLFDDPVLPAHRRILNSFRGPVGSITATLVVTLLVGLIWVGPSFFSPSNIQIVGVSVAIPLIVGVMASFALLAGVVDLSIGSMVGFGAVIFNQLVAAGLNAWLVALITVVVGVVVAVLEVAVAIRVVAQGHGVVFHAVLLISRRWPRRRALRGRAAGSGSA